MLSENLKMQMLALNGAIFVSMLGFGIISPILPIYAADMGATSLMLGVIFGAFSLSRALVVPWVGILSDNLGRKRFMLISLLGFGVLALLLIWAASPWDLAINRLVQGIFSAMLLPVASAMVADLAPTGFEGRAFAGFNTAFLLGLGTGPFVGGLVYDVLGVNANFIFLSAVCFISFVMVLFWVGDTVPAKLKDETGGFWRDLRLMRDRTMQGLFINRMACNLGTAIYLSFLPVLGASKGLSSFEIGILFGANTLVMTIIQKPSSWLADTRFRLAIGISGSVMVGVCRILLVWADSFVAFFMVIILDGLAAGMLMPAINALGIEAGRRVHAGMGAVMGFFTLALSVGFLLGPILGGWVADHTSLQTCFYIIGVCVILGSLAPLVMKPPVSLNNEPEITRDGPVNES